MKNNFEDEYFEILKWTMEQGDIRYADLDPNKIDQLIIGDGVKGMHNT